jgi:hypothetical protein
MIESVTAANVPPARPAARTEKAPPATTAPVKEASETVTVSKVDTLQLSVPVQARLLQLQGMAADQIALRLDLDILTVSRYLQG